MASGKRTKSNTGKGRRRTGSSRQRQTEMLDVRLQDEILLILFLAFCIFLFLCNFNLIGPIGNTLSSVEFGLFGLPAYLAPIGLFFAVAFHMTNRGSGAAARKLAAGIVLFILLEMICELIAGNVFDMTAFHAADFYLNASADRSGGGFLAGILTYLCYHYLSMAGTVILILVLALICIVLVTEKSVLSGAKKSGQAAESMMDHVARYHDERARARRELQEQQEAETADEEGAEPEVSYREQRREERKRRAEQERESRRQERERQLEEAENERILRMDKKSRGVTTDTTLEETPMDPAYAKVRDDIHEITLQDTDPFAGEDVTLQPAVPVKSPQDTEFAPTIHAVRQKDSDAEPVIQQTAKSPDLSEMPEPVTEKHPREGQGIEQVPDTGNSANAASRPVPSVKPEKLEKPAAKYQFPPVTLLQKGQQNSKGDNSQELKETALILQQTLSSFHVNAKVTDISQGPAVTRYELQPEQGVKVSRIVNLADDIKLNLAATDVRIEAPIPGKAAVGIEVPNKGISMVAFRDLIESKEYKEFPAKLTFAVGKDIAGQVVVTDIAKMPHLLIAGATGSGKSVCINTIIMSILYKARPDEVKMIMIDPKVVELSVYNGIPHLLLPVVTDPKKAAASLQWGVAEMTDRYQKFADANVRDLKGYNKRAEEMQKAGDPAAPSVLPQILIVVDELADLMMVAPGEVEEAICRLAQLARAAGIHLIIATQRPSVDVITGLIKANMPSRIAFAVSSGVDSRTILDMNGAEKLLGKGDMLFYPQGYPKPTRIQGAFISDKEVQDIVDFLKNQNIICDYQPNIEEQMKATANVDAQSSVNPEPAVDELFAEAGKFIIDKDKASIGLLQRVFKIGFNRAARIMDQLCEAGVVSEEDGTKPRKVLMSEEQFESYIEESV